MTFDSFSDFLAMGHHALYVWSAYGACLLAVLWNLGVPILARRRQLQEEARRLRREHIQ